MKKNSKKNIIAITLGDLDGIGAEVTYKALKQHNYEFPILLIGENSNYPGKDYNIIKEIDEIGDKGTYFLNITGGKNDPSFEYVKKATGLALENKVRAIVTAPISKEKWISSGVKYPGHTDYLAAKAGVKKWAMFFWSENMKVALYTTHIPLREIFSKINKIDLKEFCRFINSELKRITGNEFTLLMSGLNPHAGEGGILGNEEYEEISPAVEELKGEMDIKGPFPPDTVFLEADRVEDSVVISLYHDQGLIPFKLLNINSGVNLTLGLPFIRTSPDHGTAYDIAGKGIADPSSMIEAISLAEKLIKNS
ncbi:MAG: 4-hydroxythreonine-4-phosphate dehydrogenase PdxA [Acidobacteriota bacterium]